MTDAAVPNAGATASGGVATTGNGNTAIDLEYIRLDPETSPEIGVADYVASHLSGRVLDVSTHERSLPHDGHLVQTSVDDSSPLVPLERAKIDEAVATIDTEPPF